MACEHPARRVVVFAGNSGGSTRTNMSTGIVYLRPVRVAFTRHYGTLADASIAAWQEMADMLATTRSLRDMQRGFGLTRKSAARAGHDCYDACVEFSEDLELELSTDVRYQLISGGSYLRERHRGSPESMGSTFSKLKNEEGPRRGLSVDLDRPFMEIYMFGKGDLYGHKRVDACVPVLPFAN